MVFFKSAAAILLIPLFTVLSSAQSRFRYDTTVIFSASRISLDDHGKPLAGFSRQLQTLYTLSQEDSLLKVRVFPVPGYSPADSFTLNLSGNAKHLPVPGNERIVSFAVDKNRNLLMLTDVRIILWKPKGAGYVLAGSIPNRYSYGKVRAMDDRFILSECYNFHPLDQKQKCIISVYDPESMEIIRTIFPKVDGIAFSHLVNNWIDASNDRVLLVDPVRYQVLLYDKDLKPAGVVNGPAGSYSFPERKDLDRLPKMPGKELVEKVRELDKKYDRIEKAYFINDTLVLVSLRKSGSAFEKRQLEVWDITRTPHMIHSREYITDIMLLGKRDVLDRDHVPFSEITYSGDLFIAGNKICYFSNTMIGINLNSPVQEQIDYENNIYDGAGSFMRGFRIFEFGE
jgi:hypothetical protein